MVGFIIAWLLKFSFGTCEMALNGTVSDRNLCKLPNRGQSCFTVMIVISFTTLVSFVNFQVKDFNRFSLLITCSLFIQMLLKFSKVTSSNLRQIMILQKS